MNIGIIGAGNIGFTVAKLFIGVGHRIALSNARGPKSLKDKIAQLGPGALATTVNEAANFGDVVLLAVPFRTPEALPHPDMVANKIVIDAMNPYAADYSVINLSPSTSSEETAKRLPDARVVKAFNTIGAQHLATQGDKSKPEGERRAIFVAGDDVKAKGIVANLIRQIGFAPVDTGSLHDGGLKQQPNTVLYTKPMTGAEAQTVLNPLRAYY